MPSKIYAIILAGGEGKRLWPVSKADVPKYALPLTGKKSLLQQAYDRMKAIAPSARVYVATQRKQARCIKQQLPSLKPKNLIIEPIGRNTAAAIGLVAKKISAKDPDATLVIVAADQFIGQTSKFKAAAKRAAQAAADGSLIVTGVKPTFPATGYGYVKINEKLKIKNEKLRKDVYKISRFTEKPGLKTAEKFFKSKKYYWNAGIFAWRADAILKAIRRHMPRLAGVLSNYSDARYRALPKVSIDYGVLEKARNVKAVIADFDWDDVGSWRALERIMKKDKNGNVIKAKAKVIDTRNCIIIGDKKHTIGTIGVDNIVVVHTPQATLVCSKEAAERVKELCTDKRS